MKLAGLVSVFLAQKWNWLWFHDFMGLKLWNRPDSVGKKMKLTAAAQPRAVSFIFFPDRIWRFHNFMPLKSWNHQPVSFLMRKKSETNTSQFHSSFTWNWSKIKNKNKGGFYWNLIFYIKQGNKSRVGTFFQNMLVLLKWTKPTYVKGWETTLDGRYLLHI